MATTTTNDQEDLTNIYKSYGDLINESLNVDISPLINNLDQIILNFNLILKSSNETENQWKNYKNIVVPSILMKESELEKLYSQIDDYQLLIKCWMSVCEELERKMDIAENEYSSLSRMRKFLNKKFQNPLKANESHHNNGGTQSSSSSTTTTAQDSYSSVAGSTLTVLLHDKLFHNKENNS